MSAITTGTALAISMGTALAGTAVNALGQAQQASAQAGMAGYQAQVARNNQMISEWYAQRALQQGSVDEQNARSKSAALLGAQRAALAAQGGDVNSGSPLDIQADTARAGEYDAQTIRNSAALKAYNYRLQGYNSAADASRYDTQGANTMAALPFAIGSSLLGGAKSIAGAWPSSPGSAVSNYIPGTNITYADGLAAGLIPV
jgi:hypothetical protein